MLVKLRLQSISIEKILPFRELCTLATDGLRVNTLIGDQVAIRTLVQLDGDVLTFVNPSVRITARDQAANEEHWEKVQGDLWKVSRQLRSIVHSITWAAAGVIFVIIACSTLRDASPQSWDTWTWILHVLANVVLPIGIGSVAYVGILRRKLAPIFLKALRFRIEMHSGLVRRREVIAAKRGVGGYRL